MYEHAFPLTSQGHRYAQLQRALRTGNAHLALAAAAQLRQVDLADALSLVLLIRDDDPLRYERAAAGLAAYSPHDLRHRYVSVQMSRGVPVTNLAAQVGHTRTSMTFDTYSHVLLDESER
jgi:integrase